MPFWKPDCGFSEMLQNRLRFQNLGKPRTAGLCGRAAGACDCGLLSCAFIERANKWRNSPKRDLAGRENPSPKARFPTVGAVFTGPFSHIAHKRRNTGPSLSRPQRGFVLSAKLPPKEQPEKVDARPYGVCPLSSASRPRWAAQPGRCCFRSRERFSLAVFVLTVSSPAPAAVPVPRGIAVRSRGDSYQSASDSIPPSSAAAPPAPPR